MPARHIVVVGSINMDLVARVPHVPAPGETILGRDFAMLPGGKGANQAVAAARLGVPTHMVGRVGNDELGGKLLAALRDAGVETAHVRMTDHISTGIAMITVADSGENAITVASGANFAVTQADIEEAIDLIQSAALCVVQLELPIPVVARTIELCRKYQVKTILDPAPAPQTALPATLWRADLISPNETEAAALSGLPVETPPERVAARLHEQGATGVVLKLGARGAYISVAGATAAIHGFSVNPVDTTAAGDAFTGALAVALAEGMSLQNAAKFANAAGALACTRHGAQPSMPTREEVNALLRS